LPTESRDGLPHWTDRLFAGAVVLAAVLCVVVLARIEPLPAGHGTHVQLGLAPCSWPKAVGGPCPTCGVTTAACHLVHLRPLRALAVQPFGALLGVAGLCAAGHALACVARRRPFLASLARLPYGSLLVAAVLVFLGSWLYKWLTFSP
jgi:hypothetical protein